MPFGLDPQHSRGTPRAAVLVGDTCGVGPVHPASGWVLNTQRLLAVAEYLPSGRCHSTHFSWADAFLSGEFAASAMSMLGCHSLAQRPGARSRSALASVSSPGAWVS